MRELNRSCQPVGASSAQSGVGPEIVVGLCVERSLEMMVGLIGILKAGGAYLPLDPGLPARTARLHARRMPAPGCWSPSRTASTSLPEHTLRIVRLDADWPAIARQPANAPSIRASPA